MADALRFRLDARGGRLVISGHDDSRARLPRAAAAEATDGVAVEVDGGGRLVISGHGAGAGRRLPAPAGDFAADVTGERSPGEVLSSSIQPAPPTVELSE